MGVLPGDKRAGVRVDAAPRCHPRPVPRGNAFKRPRKSSSRKAKLDNALNVLRESTEQPRTSEDVLVEVVEVGDLGVRGKLYKNGIVEVSPESVKKGAGILELLKFLPNEKDMAVKNGLLTSCRVLEVLGGKHGNGKWYVSMRVPDGKHGTSLENHLAPEFLKYKESWVHTRIVAAISL
jgi:hypothetical protein